MVLVCLRLVWGHGVVLPIPQYIPDQTVATSVKNDLDGISGFVNSCGSLSKKRKCERAWGRCLIILFSRNNKNQSQVIAKVS
jgi:hypothetical protein